MKKITVIFPTADEAQYFKREDVEVAYCGVGLIAATFGTYKAILETKPDIIIMGGIAGVYKGVELAIGDSVLVTEEHQADLGLFYEDGFRHISSDCFDMNFEVLSPIECPHIKPYMPLKRGTSNSMNCAIASFVETQGRDVESMEGAGFFYTCSKLGVEFLEVRTISNVVDTNHDAWDYVTSIKNLTSSLNLLIDKIRENE